MEYIRTQTASHADAKKALAGR